MSPTIQITLSMVIFGTIGIFRRWIPLPSSFVAMSRGAIGAAFLLIVLLLRGKRLDFKAIRKRLPLLCLTGAMLGANWILLFEAYNYTSVATATLCYYFAPMFIILASPALLHERLTPKKLICVAAAVLGMVFVSGVIETGVKNISELKGVLLGLAAAVLYAGIVLFNKKTTGVSGTDRTVVQLAVSSVTLLPYVLLTENVAAMTFAPATVALLIFVGIVHTGLAYQLYFSSIPHISAQTAAILSYIDPVLAVILSALLLHEQMTVLSVIGAVLVIGAALVSELPERK